MTMVLVSPEELKSKECSDLLDAEVERNSGDRSALPN